MYSENQIDRLIEPIVLYYSQLETELIIDICKRLKPDDISGTAEWRLKKLSELGALNRKNIDIIRKTTGVTDKDINNVIEDIGLKAVTDDDKLYTKAFGELPPISPDILEVVVAAQTQAIEYQNLVGTRALQSVQEEFINIVEKVYLQVQTGEFDYGGSVRRAVNQLCDTGITAITYRSEAGRITRRNLDTAIRQMILDTVGRTSAQMQLDRAEQVGAEYVEVSSHLGERPSHALWSGRIYQLVGEGKYPNFYERTHYGEISERSLLGYNCRHTFFPYIPGVSTRTFYPQESKENERIYNLRSEQRYNERKIREYKRKSKAFEALGDDDELKRTKKRLRGWQNRQTKLLKDNPILKRDYERERI